MLPLLLLLAQVSVVPMDLTVTQASQTVVLLHGKDRNGDGVLGTGFLVQLPGGLYLVTAEHVVSGLVADQKVTYGAEGDVVRTVDLRDLSGGKPPAWVLHGGADVAVLSLAGPPEVMKVLSARALQPPHLINKLEAPSRERTLTTLGFPLGLGGIALGPDGRISPLSRESHAASGLLTLARFDTKKPSTFFVLDNPSIGGFSGAPVFMLSGTVVSQGGIGFTPPVSFCMGLVHGTIGDSTGGKMAAVVPVVFITETLEKAMKQP